jgi:hypothetical protein
MTANRVDMDKIKNDLNSIGFIESIYPVYMVNNTENKCFMVNLPNRYDNYPNLPNTGPDKFYQNTSNDIIVMYFQGLTMNLVVNQINGIKPEINNNGSVKCSYCTSTINSNLHIKSGCAGYVDKSYYYCLDCFRVMCPLCHNETDLNTAIKHKANISNFWKRLPDVIKCINEHDMTLIPATAITPNCVCDICDETIELFRNFNTLDDNLNLYNFDKEQVAWYSNRGKEIDICMNCYDTEEGKQIIETNNLKLCPFIPVCYYTKFGSLLDWIPVYVSSASDFILCNLNPDSKYYQRLAFCSNYYGFNIYILPQRYSMKTEMETDKFHTKLGECIDFRSFCVGFHMQHIESVITSLFHY